MRNTFKKSFAILLVICMLFASVPFTASAVAAEAASLAELQSALSSGADIIDVTADIQLTSAITVNGKVTIQSSNGSSIARAASYASYMFVVANGGELTLADITVNGNRTSYETAQLATEMIVVQDGGILNFNDGALLTTNRGNAANNGGGITVVGTMNMNGGSITNIHMHNSGSATVQYGAAISVVGGTVNMYGGVIGGNGGQNDGRNGAIGVVSGTFNMYGGEISYNVANEQGGGAGGVHISAAGTFNLEDGSVSNNNSRRNGGGFYNEGTLNISGGIVSGNTATYTDKSDPSIFFGAGIYNTGILNITGGEISGNTAKSCGGAVYNLGTMAVSGGIISGNSSQMYSAGGIFVDGNGSLNLSGGMITNNTAGQYGGAIAVTSSNSKALVITGGAFSGNGCGANQCGGDIYITTANSSNVNTAYSYECKTYTLFIDNVGSRYSASNANPATSSVLTAGYGYVFAENGEGHKFGDWTQTADPTCTEKGARERTCPNCGKVEVEAIAALGHDWDNGKTLTAATCTTPGEKLFTCTVCGETEVSVVNALGHTKGTVTTIDPTCTTAGSTSYACTVCGEVITETIAALGHKSATTTVPATCTEAGYTSVTCSVCGEELSHTIIAALGHKDGEWVVIKEATRQETGLKELKCAVCGETIDTEIIPLIPDPTVAAATVEADQGAKNVKVPVTFVGNDGIWSMGFYVYYDAALDLNGVIAGDIFEEIVASDYNVDPAADARAAAAFVAAGVSTDGVLCYKLYAESLNLNNIKVDGTVATLVFNLPNNDTYEFVVGIVPVAGNTINNEGVALEYFTKNGAIVIPELDPCTHANAAWETITEATCTTAGSKALICGDCGRTLDTAVIAALGHSYGAFVETKAPTCTASGIETATCSVCGATKTNAIAAFGHSYGEYVETTAPTCTTAGVKTATCSVCGATKTQPIAALGHTEGDWAEEGDKLVKRCTVCGTIIAQKDLTSDAASILVGSASATAGEAFTIDVSIDNNPGVWGALVYVYYDEALELTGITAGKVFGDITYDESVFNAAPDYTADSALAFEECGVGMAGKKVTAVYLESADLANITADGILFAATFTAAEAGEYEVGVVYSAENVFNTDYVNVPLEVAAGTATIKAAPTPVEDASLVIDSDSVDEGATANINVSIENNPGVWGGLVYIYYDAAVEVTDIIAGNLYEVTYDATVFNAAPDYTADSALAFAECGVDMAGKKVTAVYFESADLDDVTADGAIFTVALTSAEAGEYEVGVVYSAENVFNAEYTNVGLDVVNGTVEFAEAGCAHTSYTWVIEEEATADAAGLKVLYCDACGEAIAEKVIPALGDVQINLSDAVAAENEAFDVELNYVNNPGIYNIRVFLVYDAALSVTGAEIGDAYAAGLEFTPSDFDCDPTSTKLFKDVFAANGIETAGKKVVTFFFEAYEFENVTGDGILATVTFAGAEAGVYDIDLISFIPDAFDLDLNDIYMSYEGTVAVIGAEEPVECEHDYEAVVTEPTCTEAGYTTYTCTLCGDSYVADEVDALGHDYEAVVTAPTCTEVGYTTYTCSVCGDSYVDDEVEALGHDYVAVVTAPTCTEAGYTTYTCSVCGDSYVADEVDALGHDYVAVVTAPTCTEAGYTTYTCSVCGDSYVADEVAALGHTDGEWVVEKQPTYTEKGLKVLYCAVCGEKIDEEEIPVLVPTTRKLGDVNGDGRINLLDNMIFKQYLVGITNDIVFENADIDGNGRINMLDRKYFRQYLAGDLSYADLEWIHG